MTETMAGVTIPAQRSTEVVVNQAVDAFHRAWAAMVAVFPRGSHSVTEGVVRCRTGLPVAPFNGVWGATKDVDPAALLAAVDEFAAGDLPWNLQLRPGCAEGLDDAFAQRGLVPTSAIPFMVLSDVERLRSAIPVGADLRLAMSFADVDALLSLLERGFGMPPQLTRHQFPIALFGLPGMATTILRADGADVSTALGAVDGDLCGVFNVATPEEHRRHGHGAAATAHAVLHGALAGATAAYLQASPMGFPVYERLGFATVEHWQQWMPKELVD
jgi:hypothetical protein